MNAIHRLAASADMSEDIPAIRLHRMLRPFLKNTNVNKVDNTLTCRYESKLVDHVLQKTLHYDKMNDKYHGPLGDSLIIRTPARFEGTTIIQFV